MGFLTEKSTLLAAIQRASSVTGNDRGMACLQLHAVDDKIDVRATNGVVRYSEIVDVDFDGWETSAYSAQRLSVTVSALADGAVDVSVDDGGTATIKSGRRKFKIAGFPVSELPDAYVSHETAGLLIPSRELASVIDQTKHAMYTDDRAINGMLIESNGKHIMATTYDDRRFAIATEAVISPEFKVQPPSSSIDAIRNLCDLGADVGIERVDGKIRVVAGSVAMLISEHSQANMPPIWDQLKHADDPSFRVEDPVALADAIRSTSVAMQTGQPRFDIKLCDDGLSLVAFGGQSEATDTVDVARKSDAEFDVRVDPAYLRDALKQTGACDVGMLMGKVVLLRRDESLFCGIAMIDKGAMQ